MPTHFRIDVEEPSSLPVWIVDKRPDEQKGYRSPATLGEPVHIFGDSNFEPSLFDIVSKGIQSSYNPDNTHEVLEISSLEVLLYDPGNAPGIDESQYGAIMDQQIAAGQYSPVADIVSRLIIHGIESRKTKRYLVCNLRAIWRGRDVAVSHDAYVVQNRMSGDIGNALSELSEKLVQEIERLRDEMAGKSRAAAQP